MPSPILTATQIAQFRALLLAWYRANARALPWRATHEAYHIWVSEIMLQQTRVAAVIEHYHSFLHRFPTLVSLALAPEQDVLAAWSGLGYYRRARMLHKAAQFILQEHQGSLPQTANELRKLPGIGDYTSAAIASIAFGEPVAAVDGNVERVLLRLFGLPEDTSKGTADILRKQAAAMLETRHPGDFNQAMMELGATICLPRGPLCLQCPVQELCKTQGEHVTAPRAKMRSREVAHLLATRKRRTATEVLLQQRPAEASLMAGMWELPEVGLDKAADLPLLLNVRHSITTTNYYVCIYAAGAEQIAELEKQTGRREWMRTSMLSTLPLTGLARKVLQRLELMTVHLPQLPGKGTPAKVRSVLV
ncbi:MAG: A/G-specific adenine glycosylase [Acidobacteriaceae bacterium]